MKEKLKNGPWELIACDVVPDEIMEIQKRVVYWSSQSTKIDLILTSGGTGFAQRDVTPEAIMPIITKNAPGLVHLMLSKSLEITQMAALSRPVCGTVNKTLVLTLPGSPKGAAENFDSVASVIPHALDLIREAKDITDKFHSGINGHDCVKRLDNISIDGTRFLLNF